MCSSIVKSPVYFKQNQRASVTSFRTKSDQNEVWLSVVSGVRNSLPNQSFWKRVFQLVNTFELPLVHGNDVLKTKITKNCIYKSTMMHVCKHAAKTDTKEQKLVNKVFIFVFKYNYLRLYGWTTEVTLTILTMSLLPFQALNISVTLLSPQGQKSLGFYQKYLDFCSED